MPEPIDVTAAENEIDAEANQREAARRVEMLNSRQALAYQRIMHAVRDENSPDRLFFVDGPGGSGKTFLYETRFYEVSGLQLHVDC